MGLRGNRLALLVGALISIVISIALVFFLAYLDARKYDAGFDWVGSSSLQPLAMLTVGVFVLGLGLLVAGLLRKPEE